MKSNFYKIMIICLICWCFYTFFVFSSIEQCYLCQFLLKKNPSTLLFRCIPNQCGSGWGETSRFGGSLIKINGIQVSDLWLAICNTTLTLWFLKLKKFNMIQKLCSHCLAIAWIYQHGAASGCIPKKDRTSAGWGRYRVHTEPWSRWFKLQNDTGQAFFFCMLHAHQLDRDSVLTVSLFSSS